VSVVCPGPVDTPLLDTGGVGGDAAAIDVRRYLTSAAGRAVPADVVAEATLGAIRRNGAVTVPGRAGSMAWLAARLSPRAAERLVARTMRRELALRSAATPPRAGA
jgi:short-subunit dehydrogenase